MRQRTGNQLFIALTVLLAATILLLSAGIAVLRAARPDSDQTTAASATPTLLVTTTAEETAPPATATVPPAGSAQTPTAPVASPTEALPPTVTFAPPATPQVHTVESGESLSYIAELYGLSLDELIALNPQIADPNNVQVGVAVTVRAGVSAPPTATLPPPTTDPAATAAPTTSAPTATATAEGPLVESTGSYDKLLLGSSTFGHPIYDYVFGDGPVHVAFVGGIHGGYEWNTIALAYELIDYLDANPATVPVSVTLHLIPNMNPDGLALVSNAMEWVTAANVADQTTEGTIAGRFNGAVVDLNRNWGCNWSPEATWRNEPVSPGAQAFSEVENRLVRDYLQGVGAQAIIFWHSASGIVSPGRCNDVTHAGSDELANIYSRAAGYTMQPFLAYDVTGDASDWWASTGIPSAAVELTNHIDTEFTKNLRGLEAVLAFYAARAGEEGN